MGKEFFEFLEEEFQGLTSQIQEALKQELLLLRNAQSSTTNGNEDNTPPIDIPVLFTRCHAIYQQMRAEARRAMKRTPEFKDRLTLYSIQLTALLEHYQNSQFGEEPTVVPSEAPSPKLRELTFTFTIDDEDEETSTML